MNTEPKFNVCPVHILDYLPSNTLLPSATALGFRQSSFDPHNSSSEDEEYMTPNNVGETTPGQSDCAVHFLVAARTYFNSHPETTKN